MSQPLQKIRTKLNFFCLKSKKKNTQGAYFVLNGGLLTFVQMDFDQFGAVQLDTNTLADDFSRVDQVVQSVLVHGRQCATDWSLLFVASSGFACGFRQDFSLRNRKKLSFF